ncbi:F0F1 ATP synthase subunit delta [Paenibacillus abyssi]|uniref:ATP synthase subunit delta n=1 Tax=Paenibacillus abyssi TaxID=1340531 RepID=A0A917FNM3_9BACL|nr:F0F1 ATP synthase subunit delta [Paenibacillus abyssi]GGF91895.1 ATP synthase subunit delta [Paenibacillus abyssi]
MSRETLVAKRYAKALFELAQQNNVVSDVEDQLMLVVRALEGDADIVKFLVSPNISTDKKIDLVKQALSGKVSEMVIQTIELLISRGRNDIIGEVYSAYKKVAGEALGQADAIVYTAKQLPEDEMQKIGIRFGAMIGKKIRVEQIVEPALLGGIQVRIGDRLYDGSLSGKLARLEKSLKSQAL